MVERKGENDWVSFLVKEQGTKDGWLASSRLAEISPVA